MERVRIGCEVRRGGAGSWPPRCGSAASTRGAALLVRVRVKVGVKVRARVLRLVLGLGLGLALRGELTTPSERVTHLQRERERQQRGPRGEPLRAYVAAGSRGGAAFFSDLKQPKVIARLQDEGFETGRAASLGPDYQARRRLGALASGEGPSRAFGRALTKDQGQRYGGERIYNLPLGTERKVTERRKKVLYMVTGSAARNAVSRRACADQPYKIEK